MGGCKYFATYPRNYFARYAVLAGNMAKQKPLGFGWSRSCLSRRAAPFHNLASVPNGHEPPPCRARRFKYCVETYFVVSPFRRFGRNFERRSKLCGRRFTSVYLTLIFRRLRLGTTRYIACKYGRNCPPFKSSVNPVRRSSYQQVNFGSFPCMGRDSVHIRNSGRNADRRLFWDAKTRGTIPGQITRLTAWYHRARTRITPNSTFPALIANACLGNGFARIHRDASFQPYALELIPPHMVQIDHSDDGSLIYKISGKRAGRSVNITLMDFEMIHIKGVTFNGASGEKISLIHRDNISSSLAAQKYTDNFFSNGTHLSGTLTTDMELSEKAAENAREAFKMHTADLTT